MGYQKAAVNTEAIASALNAGQGTILAVGLTGVLAVAAATAGVGTFTAGDLVSSSCISTLALQMQKKKHRAHLSRHCMQDDW